MRPPQRTLTRAALAFALVLAGCSGERHGAPAQSDSSGEAAAESAEAPVAAGGIPDDLVEIPAPSSKHPGWIGARLDGERELKLKALDFGQATVAAQQNLQYVTVIGRHDAENKETILIRLGGFLLDQVPYPVDISELRKTKPAQATVFYYQPDAKKFRADVTSENSPLKVYLERYDPLSRRLEGIFYGTVTAKDGSTHTLEAGRFDATLFDPFSKEGRAMGAALGGNRAKPPNAPPDGKAPTPAPTNEKAPPTKSPERPPPPT